VPQRLADAEAGSRSSAVCGHCGEAFDAPAHLEAHQRYAYAVDKARRPQCDGLARRVAGPAERGADRPAPGHAQGQVALTTVASQHR
jgi:hypothetical protein